MKNLLLLLLVLYSCNFYSQYGVIGNRPDEYGPCTSYLNGLQYTYTIKDLRQDTLRLPAVGYLWAAEFIQDSGRLMEAKLFDKNGNVVSSGDLKNGNGKLIVELDGGRKNVYNFRDGKLNDTTFFYTKYDVSYRIFRDNLMIHRFGHNTESSYDDDGFAHGEENFYGRVRWFLVIRYDSYRGKLWQTNLYEHGNMVSTTFYNRDGTVKETHVSEARRTNYRKKINKNCF